MSGSGVVRSNKDEFGRAVAKVAVVQIAESAGFQSFQSSATETLADIAIRYMSNLAKKAQIYTTIAGRTECNVFDVILALEDMGASGGIFLDASQSISNSTALKEIVKYVEVAAEVPFSRPLPHFPVLRKRKMAPSFMQLGEEVPAPHIPPWLPAFPDSHTYKSTQVWNDRKIHPAADRLVLATQRREAERSLISLHQKLLSNGDGAPGSRSLLGGRSSVEFSSAMSKEQETLLSKLQDVEAIQGKGKGKRESFLKNPFLSTLPPGAKEVSPISFVPKSERKHIKNDLSEQQEPSSVLDVFAPVFNAAKRPSKDGHLPKDMYKNSIVDAKDRVPVLLTFDFGRKAQAKAMAAQLSLRTRNLSTKDGNFKSVLQEEDKDEKKRRAEQILAQAVDRVDEMNT